MEKLFYRVANIETEQGLWYDFNGNFTGLIHGMFSFCMNSDLPMPFDINIAGWLSATDTMEDLFHWFSREDIERLKEYGYRVAVYKANDYKFYNNHWLIKQDTSKLLKHSVSPILQFIDIEQVSLKKEIVNPLWVRCKSG